MELEEGGSERAARGRSGAATGVGARPEDDHNPGPGRPAGGKMVFPSRREIDESAVPVLYEFTASTQARRLGSCRGRAGP